MVMLEGEGVNQAQLQPRHGAVDPGRNSLPEVIRQRFEPPTTMSMASSFRFPTRIESTSRDSPANTQIVDSISKERWARVPDHAEHRWASEATCATARALLRPRCSPCIADVPHSHLDYHAVLCGLFMFQRHCFSFDHK